MINPSILVSEDGSTTLKSEVFNTTYHSIHGAIQESKHVYIKSGLEHFIEHNIAKKEINVLEIGLGSCLNALLTLEKTIQDSSITIYYHALEKYPVPVFILDNQNYAEKISCLSEEQVKHVFESKWEIPVLIESNFTLLKEEVDLLDFKSDRKYDVIYFDAFDPAIQPEMWSLEIMQKMAQVINPTGVLVTFSAKGQVRRDLESVGFKVERIAGPPGKREMIRATKMSLER
jgi:tRNA U34 5-methylaminomethyl-2-thiouridine-forming methyltransferase MnmC